MSWLSRYRMMRFLRSSLLVWPIASIVIAQLMSPMVRWVDERTQWELLKFGAEGAKAVVGALSASLMGFFLFALSMILIAVQVAGSQLSPRVIERVFESRTAKVTLSVFVFSFTYSLSVLGRIEGRVPQLPVFLVVFSSVFCVMLFILMIQTVSQGFRPISVLTRTANDTWAVLDASYPRPFVTDVGKSTSPSFDPSGLARTITYRGRSGVLLDFDADRLAGIATRAGCAIELAPEVGDFLATGEELFRLHGPGAEAVGEGSLNRSIAIGMERTMEKDPAFGFRIIVDIANKALSPAINDPTTAVQAIHQLEHLLHLLSQREISTGVVRDSSGEVRLSFRTPNWEDFVILAVTEIRLYGGTNPQVTRRLRAMLERLLRVVHPERSRVLEKEMSLLQSTIDRSFADPEDRRRAAVADLQGFGSREPDRKGLR